MLRSAPEFKVTIELGAIISCICQVLPASSEIANLSQLNCAPDIYKSPCFETWAGKTFTLKGLFTFCHVIP